MLVSNVFFSLYSVPISSFSNVTIESLIVHTFYCDVWKGIFMKDNSILRKFWRCFYTFCFKLPDWLKLSVIIKLRVWVTLLFRFNSFWAESYLDIISNSCNSCTTFPSAMLKKAYLFLRLTTISYVKLRN